MGGGLYSECCPSDVEFDEESLNGMEAMAMSVFFKVLKGGNLIKVHYRVMSFGQNVALVVGNNFVKFNEICLYFVKFMAEICRK